MSRHSSDLLLGSTSDDGPLTPCEPYTDQPRQSSGADRPFSPHSAFSSSPALSDAEWGSDTTSMHSEGKPLLSYHTPPPDYERVGTRSGAWHSVAAKQIMPGSAPVELPACDHQRLLIDIDVEPQHPPVTVNVYTKCRRREERRRKFRSCCIRIPKAIRVIAVFVFFGLAAAVILWGKAVFGWMSVCLIKDFASRDYQIQTLQHFDFSNTDNQNSGLPRRFRGVMHVLSGPSHQTADLNVSIRSIASDLHGGKSGADWRPTSLISCAEVSLYFRPDLELSSLRIESDRLRVVLSSDIIVTESTSLYLRNGGLVSKHFSYSRETYIDARSSSVSGVFSIRDVLSIKTRSGSVSVDINPEPADKNRPKPAVLDIESRSGSVNIQYPGNRAGKANIPDRDYRSTITSRSGSVSGTFLHGSETTFKIRSGSLNAQVLPCGMNGDSSSLVTKMDSGSSNIELLSPYSQHGNPLTQMSSSHSSKSGQLNLRYPDEWQGSIYGKARSGSLNLHGRDVHIIDKGTKNGNKYVQAQKGNGKSKLQFDIWSGGVDATIGSI